MINTANDLYEAIQNIEQQLRDKELASAKIVSNRVKLPDITLPLSPVAQAYLKGREHDYDTLVIVPNAAVDKIDFSKFSSLANGATIKTEYEPTRQLRQLQGSIVEPILYKRKTKVYIASSTYNIVGASAIAHILKREDYDVTSSWLTDVSKVDTNEDVLRIHKSNLDNPHVNNVKPTHPHLIQRAILDFADIDKSDIVVMVYPYGYGTASEIGYAVAKGKRCLFLTDKRHVEDMPLASGLHLRNHPHSLCLSITDLLGRLELMSAY